MPRLLVLTPGELTRDPRGRRSALAAVAHGYDVVGVCPRTADSPVDLPGVRLTYVRAETFAPRLNRIGLGGMTRRERPVMRELRGLYRLLRLLRLTWLTFRSARRLGAFDVIHAHEVDMLPAAFLLRRRARIVYDAHEIYASAEPDPPRLHRGATGLIERTLARRADAVVTVSDAIAADLAVDLGLATPPVTVLNCPSTDLDVAVEPSGSQLRAIYQGAMGPGRPIDDLLVASDAAPDVELTVRVTNTDLDALRREAERRGLSGRLHVVEPVPPSELVRALTGFDVGVIFNRPVTRNDELVFPNKLFEYMMAGLALVVPALPSLGPFVEEHAIGVTFAAGDPQAMGAALQSLAGRPDDVLRMRRRARELALERFNAEAQERVLATVWTGAD